VAESRFPIGIKLWGLLLLRALCVSQFFWGLGQAPFYTRGEAREGLGVWEMYKTGNWILPIIFKPPFFHWIGVLISLENGSVFPLVKNSKGLN
jgi:4-amino-4-deoxy-L-arabinose transferase-like glycosyltransferase